MNNEKILESDDRLHPVDGFWSLPHRRNGRTFDREVINMERFANLISTMDYVLDTKRKCHIMGGVLLSAALLFGGLAVTIMSIKDDISKEEKTYE